MSKPFIRSSFKKKNYETNNYIFVDGGHNSMTKDEAWGCVVDQNGNDLICENLKSLQYNSSLFSDSIKTEKLIIRKELLPVGYRNVIISKFNDVKIQQNNGAELLAFYAGLLIMLYTYQNEKNCIIYSDSKLIVDYWGKGHVNSNKMKTMDPIKLAYIKECGRLRTLFEQKGGKVMKISGDNNKADLGFH